MQEDWLLVATAIGEGVVGLALVVVPSIFIRLLLGVGQASPELSVACRIAGAALVAIAVSCWFGRRDGNNRARAGLIASVLIYNLGAAVILAQAGTAGLVGILLWPGVAMHSALAGWCIACLIGRRHG